MKLYNNKVLTTYFILQPIIDIITGLMKYYFNISLSLAMIIRFLFIIYCGIYILKEKNKKVYIFALIWCLYCSISTIGNFYLKNNFNVLHHLYNLFKMVYFQIVLLFFYLYFKDHKTINNETFTKMGLIVGISLVISIITKTSFCSYPGIENCLLRGYKGYFFSANEYGSIIIALLGYQIIEFLHNKKIINYITLILIVLFLSILGTKTSIMGLLGILVCFILYHVITSLFFDKEKRKNIKYVCVLFVILCAITLSIKKLPIYYNLYLQYNTVVETTLNENPEISEEDLQVEVSNALVFNGRNDFVTYNKAIYKESHIFNKLFGITDQDNYYDGILFTHINERDLHDLYMIYGIVGLIVELLLPIYLFIKFIKSILKNYKIILNDEIVILGITLVLLIGVGYMAGHSLLHPAVSFYIAYIICDLLKKVEKLS